MSFLLAAAIIVIGFTASAFQPVSRRYVDRFLRRYPIRMTAQNGPMVVGRLARVRAARLLGGFAGAWLAVVAGLLGASSNLLVTIAVGYLLGAIVAEMPSRRDRVASSGQAATLVPRRLRDYVPRWVVIAPAVIVVVTAAIDIATALGHQRPNVGSHTAWRGAVGVWAMVLALTLTLVAVRMILGRPQPYTTPEMLSADDALRAASLHCVCGGGLAIVALIASVSLSGVGALSDLQVLRWITPWLTVVLMLAALFAWFGLRVAPWLVRRPYPALDAPIL